VFFGRVLWPFCGRTEIVTEEWRKIYEKELQSCFCSGATVMAMRGGDCETGASYGDEMRGV
jgi:hypothetical protein